MVAALGGASRHRLLPQVGPQGSLTPLLNVILNDWIPGLDTEAHMFTDITRHTSANPEAGLRRFVTSRTQRNPAKPLEPRV